MVGIADEPESLSPLLGYGKDGNSNIFDGLLTHDADMKLRPALAEVLPEVSADGLTYTYRLRRGVKPAHRPRAHRGRPGRQQRRVYREAGSRGWRPTPGSGCANSSPNRPGPLAGVAKSTPW